MKKLLSLVLVVALAFLFVGCGSSDAKPTKIEVSAAGNKTTLTVGEQVALSATVTPENATDKAVEWSSEDKAIATVSANGTVTAVAKGEVDIVATAKADSSVKGTITIKVEEAAELTGIEITAQATKVEVGASITLTAAKVPANAAGVIAWSTSDAAIAKVENGKVTGVAVGKATITASVGEIKDEVEIEVVAKPEQGTIIINGGNSVDVNGDLQLTAVLKGVEGEVEWLSSDESLATVDAKGKVTGVAAGNVTITAKIGDVVGTHALTVIDRTGELTDLRLTGPDKVVIGKTVAFTGTRYPSSSLVPLIWSSLNEEVATVDAEGNVTGVAEGVAIIVLEAEGFSFKLEKQVNVIPAVATESIAISGPDKVVIEKTAQLSIVATPENATQTEATWTSSDEAIATVDENGLVAGVALGNVTITATLIENPEISATYELTVSEPVKGTGIEIVAGSTEIKVGLTATLTAKFTPEDTTEQAVLWSSSNQEVATITEKGQVQAINDGTTEITVQSVNQPELTATITITVVEQQIIQPESIVITGSEELIIGQSLRLTATVYPAGANQNVTWESKQSAGTVSPEGIITGVAAGQFRVRAVSAVDPKVASGWFKVTVVEPTPVPPYADMNGYKIIFMVADSQVKETDPYAPDYTISYNQVAKQKAWDLAEKNSNCDIVVTPYPAEAPWGPTRISWINKNAAANQAQGDVFLISSGWAKDFVDGNAIVDVSMYYKKYGRNQMSDSYKTAMTFGAGMYGITTGIADSELYTDLGLFYNYGMLQKYGIESPAKLFNEGKWTYSGFKEWALAAQAKLSADGIAALTGHPYYWWIGNSNAAGLILADVNAKAINIMDEKAQAAAGIVAQVFNEGAMDSEVSWAETSGSFIAGNALMTTGHYWFIGDSTRWSRTMWGDDTQFGYVPFPYPDGMDKAATRIAVDSFTAYVIAKGRGWNYTDGVSEEAIYRVIAEMFMDTIDFMKQDLTYDGEELKKNLLNKKLDDPESVTAALYFTAERTVYDPVHGMYTSISGSPLTGVPTSVIQKGEDYTTAFQAKYDGYLSDFLSHFG